MEKHSPQQVTDNTAKYAILRSTVLWGVVLHAKRSKQQREQNIAALYALRVSANVDLMQGKKCTGCDVSKRVAGG